MAIDIVFTVPRVINLAMQSSRAYLGATSLVSFELHLVEVALGFSRNLKVSPASTD
jgi:hypothetical protein